MKIFIQIAKIYKGEITRDMATGFDDLDAMINEVYSIQAGSYDILQKYGVHGEYENIAAPDILSEPLKPDWCHLDTRLKELFTPAEYQAARKSIINGRLHILTQYSIYNV
jgi:hypothetical protein